MRTVVGLALVGVLASAVLTGCGAGKTAPSPLDAGRAAAEMLAVAPRLPGAKDVSAFSEDAFQGPAQKPSCQPLSMRTAFWTSSMDGPTAVSYLTTHTGPHFQLEGSGSGSGASGETWTVILEPDLNSVTLPSGHRGDDALAYVIAHQGSGIGIRVDAEVVPDQAECAVSR